jgi:6-phosphogluconate dehydrogenase
MEAKADFGLIGLAVMGQNLVLNINDKGYSVMVFNRTVATVDEFLREAAKGRTTIYGAHTVEELVAGLKRPRRIMLLVKAGDAVDQTIQQFLPHLEKGDCIIDGGNSHFPDTIRRTKQLSDKGILFICTGVSGGEEGARHGPSLMPGGNPAAWPLVKEIFQAVAAKTDGVPCCDWVGEDGAGHFVKMVHNGIEYGDMQLICEAYQFMKDGLAMSAAEMHEVFAEWNKGELDSYLIEITRDILAYKDTDGSPLVEKILDTAGQKGTGKWTVITACDLGMPLTLIGEAVFARCLSAIKEERVEAAKTLRGPRAVFQGDRAKFVEDVRQALYASKIVSYAQGYQLLRAAAAEYKWNLNYGGIALMWRGGCIIRSQFLGRIKEAFQKKPKLVNLLTYPYFRTAVRKAQGGWRRTVQKAVKMGIPAPAFGSALAYFDGYRTERLPANLLQAQRDYFGAHTYERVDAPRGQFFHTNWTGTGGNITASTYTA